MKTRILPVALGALTVLGLSARPAAAQTEGYTSDTTINTATSYRYVGYATFTDAYYGRNPASPTVSLVTGGLVLNDMGVYNHSTFIMTGGTASSKLGGTDTSTFTMSGGVVGDPQRGTGTFFAEGSCTAKISGGYAGIVEGVDNSTVTITGGTTGREGYGGESFLDTTAGSFTFVGTGLSATRQSYSTYYQGYDYLLTGTLQDGQSITGKTIAVADSARMFSLVAAPEPSPAAVLSIGLLGLGALAFQARKRAA